MLGEGMSDRSVNEPSSRVIAPVARKRVASIDHYRRTKRPLRLAIAALLSIGVMGSSLPPRTMPKQPAAVEASPSVAKSQLEKRFDQFGYQFGVREKGLTREANFHRAAKALLSSDAIKDARADIAAGHIGFMTQRVRSWGVSRDHAPGVLCSSNLSEHASIVTENSLFILTFRMPGNTQQAKADKLYVKYAVMYNRFVLPHINRYNEMNNKQKKCKKTFNKTID